MCVQAKRHTNLIPLKETNKQISQNIYTENMPEIHTAKETNIIISSHYRFRESATLCITLDTR